MSSKTIYSSNNLDILEAGIYDDYIIYNNNSINNKILITSIFLMFVLSIYNIIKTFKCINEINKLIKQK